MIEMCFGEERRATASLDDTTIIRRNELLEEASTSSLSGRNGCKRIILTGTLPDQCESKTF